MKTLSYTIKAVLLLAAISPTIVLAKTTLIKNIQGYTITNNALERFTAITFTDDKIDQLYSGQTHYPQVKI